MKSNPITIDLRTLRNEELLKLRYIESVFLAICSEMTDRGLNTESPLMSIMYYPNRWGKYETLQEYLSTFTSPEDSRGDGGC